MPTPTSISIFAGGSQTVSLNSPLQTVLCQVRDESGFVMLNEPIVWSVPQSGPSGTFETTGTGPYTTSTGASGTGSSGLVTANNIVGTWVGAVQAVNQLSVSAGYNVTNTTPPIPTTLSASANNTQLAAQNSTYQPVSVLVKDQFNTPMPGVQVTFTVPSGRGTWPGGGSLSRSVNTDGSGIAASPVLTASATLGAFNLTVVSGNVTSTSLGVFTTINPAVVTSLSAASGSNQSAAPTFSFALPLVARAANALNQPVAGATITFTSPFTGASCTFPTTFSTTTATSDVSGFATSSIPTANATAGSYLVVASLAGATDANFGLTNGGVPPDLNNALAMCEV